jgi:integrase
MSLAKRNDGRWVVKYKDMEGRWKQRSFRSEEEARQFDAECQYDAAENQRLTVLEAVLVFLKNTQHCAKSIDEYEYIVCGRVKKTGGHNEGPAEILATRYVDTLTRMDLETVRENCRRKGWGITSINQCTSKLNAAFNWCVQQDLIGENPWAKYKRIGGGKYKPRSGTLEDFAKLFPVLPPWLQWAAKTAIALCLRPGIAELFSLQWSAFNWKEQSVTVFMSKVNSTKLVFPPAGYMQEAWERFQADKVRGYTLVCRNRLNRSVVASTYVAAWLTACKRAGVSMPMYALRHIAATEMLAGGADLAAVAAQLGHRNMTTTASFYTHALASSQRRAAAALPNCTNLVQNGAEFIG